MNLTQFSLIHRVLQTLDYLPFKSLAIVLDAYLVYFTNMSRQYQINDIYGFSLNGSESSLLTEKCNQIEFYKISLYKQYADTR